MRRDSRLSGVLHILLHMALSKEAAPMTSMHLAKALDTNPVVIRRIMGGLRDAGYVHSEKGHGGGWTLACDLSQTTLRDIYDALGQPTLLAIAHRTDDPECLVEEVVNVELAASFREAEAALLTRFGEVTLAMLAEKLGRRLRQHRQSADRLDHVHDP